MCKYFLNIILFVHCRNGFLLLACLFFFPVTLTSKGSLIMFASSHAVFNLDDRHHDLSVTATNHCKVIAISSLGGCLVDLWVVLEQVFCLKSQQKTAGKSMVREKKILEKLYGNSLHVICPRNQNRWIKKYNKSI